MYTYKYVYIYICTYVMKTNINSTFRVFREPSSSESGVLTSCPTVSLHVYTYIYIYIYTYTSILYIHTYTYIYILIIIIILLIIINIIMIIMLVYVVCFTYIYIYIYIYTHIYVICLPFNARIMMTDRHRLNGYLDQRVPSLVLAGSSRMCLIVQFLKVCFPGGRGTH